MKKFFIGMAAVLWMSIQVVQAEDIKVSPEITAAFEKEFPGASQVEWGKSDRFYRAIFSFEDQRLCSYFEEDGTLYSTTRYVIFNTLPVNIIKTVSQRYENASVDYAVLEISKSGRTSYLVTVKTSKMEYVLEADPSGSVYVVKKQKLG